MKYGGLIIAGVMFSLSVAVAAESDDPLLNARISLFDLKLRYTGAHPKVIEAEMYLKKITETFAEPQEEYAAHLRERIRTTEAEEAALETRYTDQHPVRIAMKAKLDFLHQELQRAEGKTQ